MKYGVCTNCGDTYRLPEDMDVSKEYKCLVCGNNYIPRVVHMDEFIFDRLKTTKGS